MLSRMANFAVTIIAGSTTIKTWGELEGTLTLVLLMVSIIAGIGFLLSFEPQDQA